MRDGIHPENQEAVSRLAELMRDSQMTVGTIESLTGGQLAAAIVSAQKASEWFCGGIVAYQADVKHSLLRTPPGPVVTEETARTMAESGAELLGATLSVALTGVGGPGPEEGEPQGTVYLATHIRGGDTRVNRYVFEGEPLEVVQQSVFTAVHALIERLEEL